MFLPLLKLSQSWDALGRSGMFCSGSTWSLNYLASRSSASPHNAAMCLTPTVSSQTKPFWCHNGTTAPNPQRSELSKTIKTHEITLPTTWNGPCPFEPANASASIPCQDWFWDMYRILDRSYHAVICGYVCVCGKDGGVARGSAFWRRRACILGCRRNGRMADEICFQNKKKLKPKP